MSERHHHRYEFNNKYRKDFISGGMVIWGTSPDENLVECFEVTNNDFL